MLAKLWRLQSVWNVSQFHSTFLGAENQSRDEYIRRKNTYCQWDGPDLAKWRIPFSVYGEGWTKLYPRNYTNPRQYYAHPSGSMRAIADERARVAQVLIAISKLQSLSEADSRSAQVLKLRVDTSRRWALPRVTWIRSTLSHTSF
jgi:hypothetical protein